MIVRTTLVSFPLHTPVPPFSKSGLSSEKLPPADAPRQILQVPRSNVLEFAGSKMNGRLKPPKSPPTLLLSAICPLAKSWVRQLIPLVQRRIFTPDTESGGVAMIQSLSFAGSIVVDPTSPAFTFSQLLPLWANAIAGAPLSCVPPKIRFGSEADSESDTNCVNDPSVAFRLSNWFVSPQEPVVRPMNPSSAR